MEYLDELEKELTEIKRGDAAAIAALARKLRRYAEAEGLTIDSSALAARVVKLQKEQKAEGG